MHIDDIRFKQPKLTHRIKAGRRVTSICKLSVSSVVFIFVSRLSYKILKHGDTRSVSTSKRSSGKGNESKRFLCVTTLRSSRNYRNKTTSFLNRIYLKIYLKYVRGSNIIKVIKNLIQYARQNNEFVMAYA